MGTRVITVALEWSSMARLTDTWGQPWPRQPSRPVHPAALSLFLESPVHRGARRTDWSPEAMLTVGFSLCNCLFKDLIGVSWAQRK